MMFDFHFNPSLPSVDIMPTYCQNFDYNITRGHGKNLVSRRYEPQDVCHNMTEKNEAVEG